MPKRETCGECPLIESPEVPYRRGLNRDILIIGQSPGRTEVERRTPFVGPSGSLMKRVISKVGLDHQTMFIANSLRCAEGIPPLSGRILTQALKLCRPNLDRFVQAVQPKLIIALGAYAIKTVLGKAKITQVRGQFFRSEEYSCDVFAMLHPAAILREATGDYPDMDFNAMTNRQKEFYQDWQMVARYVENDFTVPRIITTNYRRGTLRDLSTIQHSSIVAVDFETNTLDLMSPEARILSVSFSVSLDGISFVYPNPSRMDLSPVNIPRGSNHEDIAWTVIKDIMKNERIQKVMANRTFDEEVSFRLLGARVGGPVYDVLSLAHLNDENYHAFNLENVAAIYAGMRNIKELALGHRDDLTQLTEEELIQYNGVDTDATIKSYDVITERLNNTPMERYHDNFIQPIQDMFTDIAMTGPWCLVDQQKLFENTSLATAEMELLEAQMGHLVPQPIQEKHQEKGAVFTRPDYARDAIFRGAGNMTGVSPMRSFITPISRVPSLSEDHLKNFRGVPIVDLFLRWKKLRKIATSYLNTIGRYIRQDGRIHPGTSLTRTVTGRTVMLAPPIQTYPSRGEFAHYIRDVFVADPGTVLVALDLAQSEMRIIGWLANDQGILSALREGIDLHTKTASIMFGVPVGQVTSQMRQDAKVFNFGLIYGMSAEGLKSFLEIDHGIVKTFEECREARNTFFRGYAGLPVYYDDTLRFARRHLYVESPLGRRRHLPGINSDDYKVRGEAERQAVNFPTQSFSSDLGLIAMKLLHDAGFGTMWFIHDAVVMQVPINAELKANVANMKEIVRESTKMYIQDNFEITVGYPIECDVKLGGSWSTMVKETVYFGEEAAEKLGFIL